MSDDDAPQLRRRQQQQRHRKQTSAPVISSGSSIMSSPSPPPPSLPRHSRHHPSLSSSSSLLSSIGSHGALKRFSKQFQARQAHMSSPPTSTSSSSGGGGGGGGSNGGVSSSPARPAPPPLLYTSSPTYVTSYRDAPSNGNGSSTKGIVLDGPHADTFYTESADQLLRTLGVERKIEQWTEDVRQWFAQVVCATIVREFARSDEFMLASARQLARQGGAVLERRVRDLLSSPTCTQELVDYLCENYPSLKQMKHRRWLNRHCLDATSISDRDYVLHRFRVLAQDDFLSSFQWNGGGTWNGQRWHPHLPTDTHILLHVFTGFMSMYVEDFATTHVRVYSSKVGLKREETVVLTQLRGDPPYLIVSHPHDKWLVHPGRVNLFRAVALFFYYVKTKMKSHLRRISLSDTSLGGVHLIFDE